jgi:hypothetical protein
MKQTKTISQYFYDVSGAKLKKSQSIETNKQYYIISSPRFSRLLPTPSSDKTCSTINCTENIYLLKMYLMLPPLILHT